MLKDLRFAARTLRKTPVFTVTAVATIALDIGAASAIFSVTNAVLLRPLPYRDPGRLVFACSDMQRRNVRDFPVSNADYLDIRRQSRENFEDFAAVTTFPRVVKREDGSQEQIRSAAASTNLFRILGAKMFAGRDFAEADGIPQTGPPPDGQAGDGGRQPAIAILSYEYWQRRYAGNLAVLGQSTPYGAQIVGVLEPGFELLFPPAQEVERAPDVWLSARIAYDTRARNNVQWRLIGRLKPTGSMQAGQAELNAIAGRIRAGNSIKTTAGFQLRLEPMHGYIVEEARPAILALMSAVVFLLLIACANVANLLLVRASLRERELAVRSALGGSALRLARQMLAEAGLLAALGTAAGFGLAWLGIHELPAIAPANMPRLDAIRIDPGVALFSALAGLAACVIFGLVPAIRASRPDLISALRSSGRTGGLGAGRSLRNTVVVLEVALSFVLLIGSGLMFRSFLALQQIDSGFDPKGVLTFQVLGGRGQDPEQRAAVGRELASRLKAIPGVQSVAAANTFPLMGQFNPIRWGGEEALSDPGKFQATDFQIVMPGYFQAMRVPLLAGRGFTEDDNAPGRTTLVVDEHLAAKAFPNQNAVGRRILVRFNTPDAQWFEIVGVAKHQRDTSLALAGREQVYFPEGRVGFGLNGWAVRGAGDPSRYAGPVRAAVAAVDRGALVAEIQTMDAVVRKAQSGTRFSLLLIGMFAAIAAILAGVGLYGVLSTVVRQRTAEIGLRMALGAAPGGIFGLIVGQGLRLSAFGIGAGLISAFALTRAIASLLVGVRPYDPVTFTAMVLVFLAIAGVASWLPARRAAALDPNTALREE